MSDVTRILTALKEGRDQSAADLLPLVYEELRRLAASHIARERPGQTWQATELVHEVYLRLVGQEDPGWEGQRHFMLVAAQAMRRILVDKARRKKRLKRGGDMEPLSVDDVEISTPLPDDDLLALDEALKRLTELDPRAAELVELCSFTGLTQEEAAKRLGISRSTAERSWAFSRAWLYREIRRVQIRGERNS